MNLITNNQSPLCSTDIMQTGTQTAMSPVATDSAWSFFSHECTEVDPKRHKRKCSMSLTHTHFKGNSGGFRHRFTSSFLPTDWISIAEQYTRTAARARFLHHCNQRNKRDVQMNAFPIYTHQKLNWSDFPCNNPTMTQGQTLLVKDALSHVLR